MQAEKRMTLSRNQQWGKDLHEVEKAGDPQGALMDIPWLRWVKAISTTEHFPKRGVHDFWWKKKKLWNSQFFIEDKDTQRKVQISRSIQFDGVSQIEHPCTTSTSSRNTTYGVSWQVCSSPLSATPSPLQKSPLGLLTALAVPVFRLYINGMVHNPCSSLFGFICPTLRGWNLFIWFLGKVNFNCSMRAGQVNRSCGESYWKSENNVFFFLFSNIQTSNIHCFPILCL